MSEQKSAENLKSAQLALLESPEISLTKEQRLNRILQLSQELTSTVSLEPLLHKIVEAAAELTASEMAGILLLNEEKNELRFRVATNYTEKLVDISVPLDKSIAGASFVSGEPIIVPDVTAEPLYYQDVGNLIGVEGHSLLVVPLQFQERRIGVLEAENKKNREQFTYEDVEMLTTLAAYATIAIENAHMLQALEESRNVLEKRVRERTAELSKANMALTNEIAERIKIEDTLRRYTLELESSNQELNAFGHTVAHDLRNPLGTIIGYADALIEYHENLNHEELLDSMTTIVRVGRKMDRIIEELLLLSGVRQDVVEPHQLDMGFIVAEAQGRLVSMIAQYQAEVLSPDTWPKAVGYGPWIEEVWVNFMSNAIKYGGRPPKLELGATELPNNTVSFWIQDNGNGIPKQAQATIFKEFKRLGQVRVQGHGLGLSIVKRIVEKLGGTAGVESEGLPGRGSRFFFVLPAE